METEVVKTGKRFSWGLFAQILTIIGGLLASQDVRDLIAQYPKTVAILAVVSLIISGATKAINSYVQYCKEIKELE